MKILSLKYKLHKLVNLVFYLIVFVLGFLLGFLGNKINFDDLLSNFLFIDNAYAYTIQSGENFEFNEEYIYNKFSENENFSLVDFPYIHCYRDISGGTKLLSCYALTTIDIYNNKSTQNSYTHMYSPNKSHTYIRVSISYNDNSVLNEEFRFSNGKPNLMLVHTENTKYFTYTNFNLPDLSIFPGNVLDFSTLDDNTGDNTGGDNTGNDNTENDNIDIDIKFDNFYNFSKKLIGDLGEENYFVYDFITLGLVIVCFTFFVLLVGYILKKFFGG